MIAKITTATTMSESPKLPVAFTSCSIGLPRHTLHQKIEAIKTAGFSGIELSLPDLVSFASRHFARDVADDDYETLREAAKSVRQLCSSHGLEIIVLQPFSNFEGWPAGSKERDEAFARAKAWINIMEAVGTDMLQVGSSDSVDIASDIKTLAADLGELADMLAEKGFRLAYENWCWATHASTWKEVWAIVEATNRSNVGLCLDTFQTAGGEWGDPTTKSGKVETAGVTESELEDRYANSLRELSRTVPADKIYFLQISDAYRVDPPMSSDPDHESGLRPRGRWSHDYRPLPYDGGYLPIRQFLDAVLATGFSGWLSVEVFDGRFEEKYGDDLFGFAERAIGAYYHITVAAQFRKSKVDGLCTPECYDFVRKEDVATFFGCLGWPGLIETAIPVCNLPTHALISQRIQPLPQSTQNLLIDKFCENPCLKDVGLNDPANDDCLVRLYLGSMNGTTTRFFSLRNFKLHLNQMLDLRLDVDVMASRMGPTLVVMHWGAKIDARDVEFVLGTSTERTYHMQPKSTDIKLDEPLTTARPLLWRRTSMWVLDFNQVRRITMDDAGVELAVEAVKLNDPYFPKPLRVVGYRETDMDCNCYRISGCFSQGNRTSQRRTG
ncbi:xylose isomerase-like protein [Apodospora peruviana]|uniref:Xylose isomerase-like protein n=1 Tax=Apodospora peruviana TaxID=516989 RepID=A0AAE0IPD9_9PEZI|nr:xylose isomerase-like protein [Apodospora peruviana]